jgi:hypothetical protein
MAGFAGLIFGFAVFFARLSYWLRIAMRSDYEPTLSISVKT